MNILKVSRKSFRNCELINNNSKANLSPCRVDWDTSIKYYSKTQTSIYKIARMLSATQNNISYEIRFHSQFNGSTICFQFHLQWFCACVLFSRYTYVNVSHHASLLPHSSTPPPPTPTNQHNIRCCCFWLGPSTENPLLRKGKIRKRRIIYLCVSLGIRERVFLVNG